jgi:hypothetical protein
MPVYPIDLEEAYGAIHLENGRPLSAATIKTYINSINAIYRLITNANYDDNIDILVHPVDVIAAIDASTYRNKSMLYTSIIKLFNGLSSSNLKYDFLKPLVDRAYYPAFIKEKYTETSKLNKNLADADQLGRYLDLPTILDRIEKYPARHPSGRVMPENLKSKLILAFYFLNKWWKPRNDLGALQLAKKDDAPLLPNTGNYLLLNRANKPDSIMLNVYKTASTYGTQILKLSPVLKSILVEYMAYNNKKVGDYLFANASGMPYTDNAMLKHVYSAFLDVLDVNMTIDHARQIQITDFMRGMPSTAARIVNAAAYLHNTETAQGYVKKNIGGKLKKGKKSL